MNKKQMTQQDLNAKIYEDYSTKEIQEMKQNLINERKEHASKVKACTDGINEINFVLRMRREQMRLKEMSIKMAKDPWEGRRRPTGSKRSGE